MRHVRQRGIALLVAIIIFAVATTVAAAVTYSKAMTARRAAATYSMEEALQAGMAAEALASIALEDAASKPTIDPTQDWAQVQPPLEIDGTGIWIQAQVEDLSGRFNLNSLVMWDRTDNTFVTDPHQYEIFQRLLADLDIDQRYADLMVDWIDPNIAPSANNGGEDTLYLAQKPPYRPPNTFITHTSELLALPNFGRDNYLKIAPFVTALPYDEPVNLCTANGEILDATRDDPQNQKEYSNMTPEQLKAAREKGCFPVQQTFAGVIADPKLRDEVMRRTGVKSRYFRLRTNIRIGTAEYVLYSVLQVEGSNRVRTVQRSFGSE